MTGTLEGHWPLTEDSGSTAYDYSGNENHGTSNGGAGPTGDGTVTGPFSNSAYHFAGGDNFIGVSSPNIDDTSGVSFSGWARADDLTDERVLFSVDLNNTHWTLRFTASPGIQFFYRNTSSDEPVASNLTPSTGVWYHIVGTYDGSTLRLYIDGVEDASSSTSAALDQTESENYLAKRFGSTDFMVGDLSDLRIYSRALSPQEVQYLYQAAVQSEATFEVQHK